MRIHMLALVLVSIASTSMAHAKTYGCGVATQNWQNGSTTTCPYDSGGGVTTLAAPAAPAAPVVIVPPTIEVPPRFIECSALPKDSLPMALRKERITDFAGNLEAPEEVFGC